MDKIYNKIGAKFAGNAKETAFALNCADDLYFGYGWQFIMLNDPIFPVLDLKRAKKIFSFVRGLMAAA